MIRIQNSDKKLRIPIKISIIIQIRIPIKILMKILSEFLEQKAPEIVPWLYLPGIAEFRSH